jgi:Ca2+-binding EF-hand superfamily protein
VQKPVGDTEATVTIVCASGPRDMGQATISTVPVVQTGRVTFHTSKVSEEAPVEAGAEEKDLGGEDSGETLEFVINAVSFADTAGASRRVAFATDAQEFTDSELLDAENPRFAVEWAVRGAAADKGTLTVSDESGAGLLRVTNTLAWWAEQQTVSTSASGPFEREFTVSYAANATEGEEEPQEVTVSGTVAGEAVEAGASVSSRWVGADADVALSATVGDAVADELAANTADLFSGEGSQAGTAGVWTLTFGQAFAAAGSSFTTDVTVAEYAEQQEEAAPVAEEEAAPVAEEEAAAEPEAAVEPEAAAEPEPEAEAVAEEGDAPAPAEEEEGEEKAPEKKKKHFSEWAEALPVQAGAEWTAKRKELFASLDANSEGRLTLAELTAGLENIIHCGEELDLAALVQKAYDNACNADGQSQHAGTVEFREFWILLVYLQKYFGYMDVFDAIDENDSGKMTYDEWVAGVPIFTEKMGLVVDDLEATFNQLDQGGDKTVTFDEFFAFAVAPSIAAAKSAEEE